MKFLPLILAGLLSMAAVAHADESTFKLLNTGTTYAIRFSNTPESSPPQIVTIKRFIGNGWYQAVDQAVEKNGAVILLNTAQAVTISEAKATTE
jgi:hypothetical protein